MRVLVLSDSHAGRGLMRRCAQVLKPDGIVHLGDYYDDGEILHEEFPGALFWQVPGNCDRYRTPPFAREILIQSICGVNFYMTHGHLHGVKSGTGNLLAAARVSGADIVLYGHTHRAECYRDDSGLWVMNPGTCGSWGGSAGLVEVENGKILDCRILQEPDLEEFK